MQCSKVHNVFVPLYGSLSMMATVQPHARNAFNPNQRTNKSRRLIKSGLFIFILFCFISTLCTSSLTLFYFTGVEILVN